MFPEPLNVDDIPVYLGFAASGAHSTNTTTPFFHTVSSGFPLNQLDSVIAWQQQHSEKMHVSGIVVQVQWEASLDESIEQINHILLEYPNKIIVNLKLSTGNPATSNFDEQAIGDRICNAIALVNTIDKAELQLDTFMSLERGYAPRTGLVDRLTNLTSVGRRIASL